jgi:hypothetical protein
MSYYHDAKGKKHAITKIGVSPEGKKAIFFEDGSYREVEVCSQQGDDYYPKKVNNRAEAKEREVEQKESEGVSSRTWVKIYCDKWLSGSLRQETAELRGIWADLIALAGSGKYGDSGKIMLQNGIGLTNSQFQAILQISKNSWLKAKNQLVNSGRITIDPLGAITIINWKKYQSEYQRIKKYRTKSTFKSTQEREKEKEKKRERPGRRLSNDPDKFIKGKYGKVVRR